MAQLTIVTTPTNSGDGTPLATAFNFCNSNFSELYARFQVDPPVSLIGTTGDVPGMYAVDSTYFYYCFDTYDGTSTIWGQVTQVGNITVSSISSGTSNVKIADVNGNATTSIAGTSNVVVVATTGQYVDGLVSATGNVTGDYILGNGSQLAGLPQSYSNSNVISLLSGFGSNVISTTGTITSGNITGSNVLTGGRVSATGNIVTDQYFVGNFFGNITGNFVVPGSNTQVIFNTSGNADATAAMTFNKDSNTFTVLGVVSSLGNVIAGNVSTAGNITGGNLIGTLATASQTNITGVGTLSSLSVTANVTGGNIRTGGQVSATGNIRTANYLSVGQDINVSGDVTATSHTGTSVSVSGNVTGGNIRTGGQITATGNITGNYILGNGSQLTGITDATSIQNGNSNVTIASANSNVIINVTGVSPLAIFANTGAYITGLTSVSGNVIAGNVEAVAYTGTTFSITGNVNGGNILFSSGIVSGSGNITGGNLNVGSGNITGGNLSVDSGNITGGNLSVGTGGITLGNIINANANGVGNIGSSTGYFNTVFANATSAQYADLAENYESDAEYQAGTVVVFGGEQEITISQEAADERVAGVISTNPAHLMNAGQPGLPVALRGRVPVMVIGPVFKGDSLVTSSTSGHAQSVGRDRSYGQAVFAKALETNSDPGEKIIQAVIL